MKYIKKPIVVEAIECKGLSNKHDVEQFIGDYGDYSAYTKGFHILTLEGEMVARMGDYIIKGIKGEFYPCKPDIFKMTYDKVEEVK